MSDCCAAGFGWESIGGPPTADPELWKSPKPLVLLPAEKSPKGSGPAGAPLGGGAPDTAPREPNGAFAGVLSRPVLP